MRFRILAPAAGALLASLALAACAPAGGSMPGMDHGPATRSTASSASVGAADRMFVKMMIPHHEQAVQMADLILGKQGIDSRVTALAQQIKDAQGPEIEKMKGWMTSWGTPYTPSPSGHDMGSDNGMMSEPEMTALKAADGAEASRLFLTGMIAHHQGAVAMAQSEVKDGKDPDVVALAQQVITGQTAEITTMKDLLGSL